LLSQIGKTDRSQLGPDAVVSTSAETMWIDPVPISGKHPEDNAAPKVDIVEQSYGCSLHRT
jgi:hypothetical protein